MPSALPPQAAPRRPGAWRACLWLLPAVALLNLALTFHNVWPTPWITTRHELSIELATAVLLLGLYLEAGGAPGRRLAALLAMVFTVLCIGRYAEVTAPALYGRRINLYWDAQHLPRVMAMLAQASPWWLSLAVTAGALASLGALYALLRACCARLLDALAHPLPRRGAGMAAAALLAAYSLPGDRAGGLFATPVSAAYAGQARMLRDAVTGADVRADLDSPALPASDLDRAGGADVLLVFLESYGATTFDHPAYAARLRAPRAALAAAVSASGRHAASARITSPTFGGASWLAHSSLLSGIEIGDAASHAALLTRRRDTLVQRFSARGYRTVAVMPGLKRPWPEGAFYGFDTVYGEVDLDWHGPDFGWWRIPDQFSLARLHELEIARADRTPVFVFFPTISTHMPFRPTPPYQPDWQRLLGAQPLAGTDAAQRLRRAPQWTDLGPAYVDAVSYALTCMAGYLQRAARREMVLVLVGDHQPAASVSGRDAGLQVPVHVIADRVAVLDELLAAGFTPGLTPGGGVLMPMHRLAPLLLAALGSPRAP